MFNFLKCLNTPPFCKNKFILCFKNEMKKKKVWSEICECEIHWNCDELCHRQTKYGLKIHTQQIRQKIHPTFTCLYHVWFVLLFRKEKSSGFNESETQNSSGQMVFCCCCYCSSFLFVSRKMVWKWLYLLILNSLKKISFIISAKLREKNPLK